MHQLRSQIQNRRQLTGAGSQYGPRCTGRLDTNGRKRRTGRTHRPTASDDLKTDPRRRILGGALCNNAAHLPPHPDGPRGEWAVKFSCCTPSPSFVLSLSHLKSLWLEGPFVCFEASRPSMTHRKTVSPRMTLAVYDLGDAVHWYWAFTPDDDTPEHGLTQIGVGGLPRHWGVVFGIWTSRLSMTIWFAVSPCLPLSLDAWTPGCSRLTV